MAHQTDLFRVPQLPDTECLDADHNGSSAQQGRLAIGVADQAHIRAVGIEPPTTLCNRRPAGLLSGINRSWRLGRGSGRQLALLSRAPCGLASRRSWRDIHQRWGSADIVFVEHAEHAATQG
jgi:hypothetical protein